MRALALLLLLPGLAFGQMTGGVMDSQIRAASNITGTVSAANGGTGVANNVAATLTRSGNHALTITTTGTTGVTLPTTGTLVNTAVTSLASLTTVGTLASLVASQATSGPTATITNSHATTPYAIRAYHTTDTNDALGFFFRGDAGASVIRAEIRGNGGLANFSANNVNLSDATTKNLAGPVAANWDQWKRLVFIRYAYKDNPGAEYVGLTAQQVQTVYPDLIATFDADAGTIGVRENVLMMRMGKVVQELQARVEALESRLQRAEAANDPQYLRAAQR